MDTGIRGVGEAGRQTGRRHRGVDQGAAVIHLAGAGRREGDGSIVRGHGQSTEVFRQVIVGGDSRAPADVVGIIGAADDGLRTGRRHRRRFAVDQTEEIRRRVGQRRAVVSFAGGAGGNGQGRRVDRQDAFGVLNVIVGVVAGGDDRRRGDQRVSARVQAGAADDDAGQAVGADEGLTERILDVFIRRGAGDGGLTLGQAGIGIILRHRGNGNGARGDLNRGRGAVVLVMRVGHADTGDDLGAVAVLDHRRADQGAGNLVISGGAGRDPVIEGPEEFVAGQIAGDGQRMFLAVVFTDITGQRESTVRLGNGQRTFIQSDIVVGRLEGSGGGIDDGVGAAADLGLRAGRPDAVGHDVRRDKAVAGDRNGRHFQRAAVVLLRFAGRGQRDVAGIDGQRGHVAVIGTEIDRLDVVVARVDRRAGQRMVAGKVSIIGINQIAGIRRHDRAALDDRGVVHFFGRAVIGRYDRGQQDHGIGVEEGDVGAVPADVELAADFIILTIGRLHGSALAAVVFLPVGDGGHFPAVVGRRIIAVDREGGVVGVRDDEFSFAAGGKRDRDHTVGVVDFGALVFAGRLVDAVVILFPDIVDITGEGDGEGQIVFAVVAQRQVVHRLPDRVKRRGAVDVHADHRVTGIFRKQVADGGGVLRPADQTEAGIVFEITDVVGKRDRQIVLPVAEQILRRRAVDRLKRVDDIFAGDRIHAQAAGIDIAVGRGVGVEDHGRHLRDTHGQIVRQIQRLHADHVAERVFRVEDEFIAALIQLAVRRAGGDALQRIAVDVHDAPALELIAHRRIERSVQHIGARAVDVAGRGLVDDGRILRLLHRAADLIERADRIVHHHESAAGDPFGDQLHRSGDRRFKIVAVGLDDAVDDLMPAEQTVGEIAAGADRRITHRIVIIIGIVEDFIHTLIGVDEGLAGEVGRQAVFRSSVVPVGQAVAGMLVAEGNVEINVFAVGVADEVTGHFVFADGLAVLQPEIGGVGRREHAAVGVDIDLIPDRLPFGIDHMMGGRHGGGSEIERLGAAFVLIPADEIVVLADGGVGAGVRRAVRAQVGLIVDIAFRDVRAAVIVHIENQIELFTGMIDVDRISDVRLRTGADRRAGAVGIKRSRIGRNGEAVVLVGEIEGAARRIHMRRFHHVRFLRVGAVQLLTVMEDLGAAGRALIVEVIGVILDGKAAQQRLARAVAVGRFVPAVAGNGIPGIAVLGEALGVKAGPGQRAGSVELAAVGLGAADDIAGAAIHRAVTVIGFTPLAVAVIDPLIAAVDQTVLHRLLIVVGVGRLIGIGGIGGVGGQLGQHAVLDAVLRRVGAGGFRIAGAGIGRTVVGIGRPPGPVPHIAADVIDLLEHAVDHAVLRAVVIGRGDVAVAGIGMPVIEPAVDRNVQFDVFAVDQTVQRAGGRGGFAEAGEVVEDDAHQVAVVIDVDDGGAVGGDQTVVIGLGTAVVEAGIVVADIGGAGFGGIAAVAVACFT